MRKTIFARLTGALLVAAVSLSSCDDITSTGQHSSVEVTNGGSSTLSRIVLTYSGGGTLTAENVVPNGKGVFTAIPQGAISAAGYTTSSTPVGSATGTLTSSIAILRINW